MLSFQSMENRWGLAAAYQYLTEVEKASGIPSWAMADIDPEIRLARAIEAQDAMRQPLLMAA